jgi:hypothetical protein
MNILEVAETTPSLIEQLVAVWEKFVKATHLFLSENEVEEIKKYVRADKVCRTASRIAFILCTAVMVL